MLKIDELSLQIRRRPEQGPIEKLAPDSTDQPLHEGMRKRGVRNGLDFGHF
jgi:hypothetical protein